MIARNFGNVRGLVRLALSYGESLPGISPELAPDAAPDTAGVRRLVFVCQGNICRSAHAEAVARGLGMATASFGLSTKSGMAANPAAAQASALLGHDLSAHRTTAREDFVPHAGDLLLAMELRQIRRLARDPELAMVPRLLLGRFFSPPMPHLHDPFELGADYMMVNLARVERAVIRLARCFPAATAAPTSP